MKIPTNNRVISFFKTYGYFVAIILLIIFFVWVGVTSVMRTVLVGTKVDCPLTDKTMFYFNDEVYTISDFDYYRTLGEINLDLSIYER